MNTAIQQSQEITMRVFQKVKRLLHVGMSEEEIAQLIEKLLYAEGATGMAFPVIAALSENAAEPHHVPTSRKAKQGDLLVLDFGGVYKGMCADMTRTLFFGRPKALFQKWYTDVLEAQKRAFRAVCAGKTGTQIDAVARNYLDACGYAGKFIHALGHGIGKVVHEPPWITSHQKGGNTLAVGDVITIEPGVYFPKRGGIRIEDMCVVTQQHAEWLTASQRHVSRMIISSK